MTPTSAAEPSFTLDPEKDRVVIIGGGLASARLCGSLRRKGFKGSLVVVNAEDSAPYDRPPLSKAVLAGKRDNTLLPFDTGALEVELRTGTCATGLDTERHTVQTDAGDLPYDALAIATGASPVRLPGAGAQRTFRTLSDALTVRDHLRPGNHVLVVGASWIGAEIATAALAAGCRVTCLEYGAHPFESALGAQVGALTRLWWADVDLRTNTRVQSIEREGAVLEDGSLLPADLIITGIGVRPEVTWLRSSGIEIERGVLTDSRCRTNVPGVIALGDVAQRWSHHTRSHRLIEHWDEAGTAASVGALSLLDWSDGPEHDPVPYFWSDLFGRKLQYVGAHAPDDEVRIDQADDGSLLRAIWSRGNVLTAWLGVGLAKDLVNARQSVGGPLSELK